MTKTKKNPPTGKKSRNGAKPITTRTAPVAISRNVTIGMPSISQDNRSTRVRHREYITDVSASGSAFTIRSFPLNPGLGATFPWLADVAGRYESYVFRSMRIIYQPLCPTSTPGSLMMAVDYDARDAAPSGKVELMAMSHSTRSSVWDKATYTSAPLDLRKFGIQRYVRAGPLPANSDIKTYDVGNLFVGTSNTPASATALGELYVEYDVELYTPQITTVSAARSNEQVLNLTLSPTAANLVSTFVGAPIMAFTPTSPAGYVDLAINPAVSGSYKATFSANEPIADVLKKTPASNKLDFPAKYRLIKPEYVTDAPRTLEMILDLVDAPVANDDPNNSTMLRLKLPSSGTRIVNAVLTGLSTPLAQLLRSGTPIGMASDGPNVLSPLPDFSEFYTNSSRDNNTFRQSIDFGEARDRRLSDCSFRSDISITGGRHH